MKGIGDRGSGIGRRKFHIFCLLSSVFCLLLSGCTFFRPPGAGLPDRSSIRPGETVTVERNQNVYGIAHDHGVSMREVIVLNDLKPPFIIHPGQQLVLPAKDQDVAPAPMAAPVDGIERKPMEGYTPPYQMGSTVASAPLEPPQGLATAPVIAQSATAQPGTLGTLTPPEAQKPVATTVMGEEPKTSAPIKLAETHADVSAKAQIATAEALPKAETATPPAEITFTWPVQGPIVSSFGPSKQGTNNDGINIAAPKGAPVLAAAGGIVVYAGNEMKGFGNLVLIRHEGGWVTAYAHLDRVMVTRDTVVAPGDMIGTVGSTGGVSSPQLHFETRIEGKAVDPKTVIKKS